MRVDKYLLSSVARSGADTGGGTGAAGAGAGAGGAAGAGAAGGAAGGGQQQQQQQQNGGAGDPWYKPFNLDGDTSKWIDDHGFKTPVDAFKSARHFEKIARDRNVLERPEKGKEKEWKGWEELGWKAKLDEYKLDPGKPKEGQPDLEMADHLAKVAHEERIPLGAAQKVLEAINGIIDKRIGDLKAKGDNDSKTLEETLRTEWKGDYDVKKERAIRAARTFGLGADDSSELEKLVGSPRLLKMFAAIGDKLGEGNLITNDTGHGGAGAMTKEQAAAERRRLEGDADFMKVFNNNRHPQYRDYQARRQRLINIEAGHSG